MRGTKIEWADHTFNPWIGCTKVSAGCDNCYAAVSTPARVQGIQWGVGKPRIRTSERNWNQPKKWDAALAVQFSVWKQLKQEWKMSDERLVELGFIQPKRERVFCASLADVFDNEVPPEWRRDLFELIGETPYLDWLLLTKRIGNATDMINASKLDDGPMEPWHNLWIGATVVNQVEADRDIPKLLAVPAAKRFLSIEPMLGEIDLYLPTKVWGGNRCNHCCHGDRCDDSSHYDRKQCPYCRGTGNKRIVDWVICGGESGPGARPMHPAWARSLRDQCAVAGVPFFMKQWGEWKNAAAPSGTPGRYAMMSRDPNGWTHNSAVLTDRYPRQFNSFGSVVLERVGKKAAGRLLDGVEYNGVPS